MQMIECKQSVTVFLNNGQITLTIVPITFIVALFQDFTPIHYDQVWCRLIIICRCYSVNKVKLNNFSLFKSK